MCLCVSYNSKITKYELSNSMTIKAMIIVNRFLEIFQFHVLKALFILFNYYFFLKLQCQTENIYIFVTEKSDLEMKISFCSG